MSISVRTIEIHCDHGTVDTIRYVVFSQRPERLALLPNGGQWLARNVPTDDLELLEKLQDHGGDQRVRFVFDCAQCRTTVQVRHENLLTIARGLHRHDVTAMTLSALQGIVAPM